MVASALKSYDLYIHRQGRWLLDSSYSDRNDAVSQARRLEDAGVSESVRVVEESFDADHNASSERTIHWSANLAGATQQGAGEGGAGRGRRLDAELYRERIDKRVRARLLARYEEEREAIRRRATPGRIAVVAAVIFAVWIAGALALRYVFDSV